MYGTGKILIDSAFDVIKRIPKINDNRTIHNITARPDIRTFDFTGFYPSLDHKDLRRVLPDLIRILWGYLPGRHPIVAVDTRNNQAKIINKRDITTKPEKHVIFIALTHEIYRNHTIHAFTDMLDSLLNNCYMSHAGVTKRLIKGIPMGFACCVYLANFYLYYFEQAWVDRMIREGKHDLINYFDNCCCRLIDDILVVDFPQFTQIHHTI